MLNYIHIPKGKSLKYGKNTFDGPMTVVPHDSVPHPGQFTDGTRYQVSQNSKPDAVSVPAPAPAVPAPAPVVPAPRPPIIRPEVTQETVNAPKPVPAPQEPDATQKVENNQTTNQTPEGDKE